MGSESCDNKLCDAKTLVTFGKQSGEKTLLVGFCQHHGNKRYVTLLREGWMVLDDDRGFRIEDPRGLAAEEKKPAKRRTKRDPVRQSDTADADSSEGARETDGDDPDDAVPAT